MKTFIGLVIMILIFAWLIATAVDNMPPSEAELNGTIPAGPINPAYKGEIHAK